LGITLILAVLLTGAFGMLDKWLQTQIQNPIFLSLAFFGILGVASDWLNLPLQLYRTFVIEEKFGFNKTTYKTFFVDKLKGYALTLVVGGLVLGGLLYLLMHLGPDFWIYFLVVIAILMLLINLFYTSWIVPLFNKLNPLPDGELKSAIESYSKKIHFPIKNIFVIDGSKRSNKANAFFSGLGKRRKIVLYDTLIEKHTTEELVAVLAHEVGHYKKKHILKGYVLSILQSAVMLFIMSKMIFNQELSIALGSDQMAFHLNLLAFGLLYSPISKTIGVLTNLYSRKNEFEADAFATKTYKGSALQAALKKLSVNHLSNLLPHRWYVFFHYSHPPLLQRLEAIDEEAAGQKAIA
ncbi:MAG: M48 family metallopeptidase, partial [Cyclobacteriaceae bacterium]